MQRAIQLCDTDPPQPLSCRQVCFGVWHTLDALWLFV